MEILLWLKTSLESKTIKKNTKVSFFLRINIRSSISVQSSVEGKHFLFFAHLLMKVSTEDFRGKIYDKWRCWARQLFSLEMCNELKVSDSRSICVNSGVVQEQRKVSFAPSASVQVIDSSFECCLRVLHLLSLLSSSQIVEHLNLYWICTS